MKPSSAPDVYRPDVDGLRAVAVLSVILFHARDTLLPGGFVGVDIFFVISGYLISKHIAAQVAERKFSLTEFYRRRIRRIAPMMLLVTAASLVASALIMTPEDSRAVAKSAIWSIASMANVHFWRDLDTGYFANSSAEVPLLHLWSLGVEEQFYFLCPLLLMLGVTRLRAGPLLAATAVLALLSFALAALTFPLDASFSYYMLPTRMGELLLGTLVGVAAAITSWRPGPHAARLYGWGGAALLVFSLCFIDERDPFPSWLAMLPTLGAAFVILAGEGRANPVAGLTSAPMVFIGKISYSAYLWHWPLFALFRYSYGEPGILACTIIVALTLSLAWLSYEYVERPTRSSVERFQTVFLRQFAAPAALILIPAFSVVFADRIGLPLATDHYLQQLDRIREITRPGFSFDWNCQRQRLLPEDVTDPRCVLGAPGEAAPRVLLWGDSNAAHYVPMIGEFAERAGVRVRNFSVGACPPLFKDPRAYVDARRLSDCVASTAVLRSEVERYPVLVISASWSTYLGRAPGFLEDFEAFVRGLSQRGQTVVLLGRTPIFNAYDRRCMEKALRVPLKTCPDASEPLAPKVVQVNTQIRELARRIPNVHYFDANRYLCPADQCSRQTAGGLPRYLDVSHLSVPGARELGREVLAAEGVPAAFASLHP